MGIMELFEVPRQGPDTILLFSLVSRQSTSYVAIHYTFKVFIKMFSHDPNDFFPFMRQITDTSLYMKKFLNSCLISSTVLVNEYPSCSALLTDVTPDLNLENQSYV
jgi:hypothetical protein